MSYQIEEVRVLSLGTTAATVELGCLGFLLENNSEEATVYFREKDADGANCTADNGYALLPGERTETVLAARALSLVASAAETDVRLLIVDGH